MTDEVQIRHPKTITHSVNRRLYRERAILAFGGKCCKCGFSDSRALQFDHVNGGGCAEVKKQAMKPSYYLQILAAEEGKFQLLCANCNWIKRHESGELKDIGKKTSVTMRIYWEEVRAGKRPAPKHKI